MLSFLLLLSLLGFLNPLFLHQSIHGSSRLLWILSSSSPVLPSSKTLTSSGTDVVNLHLLLVYQGWELLLGEFIIIRCRFVMDEREVDVSNQGILLRPMSDLPSSGSMDSFIDELLKDTHVCTHIHTSNHPGPDNDHTHTCFHVHAQIVSPPADDKGGNINNDDSADAESVEKKSKSRSLGNRESVRKYREKKNARAASLEDEAARLKIVNEQLLKQLQGQAALEAEVARLKCLLVDIRGRIEGEIGSFPYQNPVKSVGMFQPFANPGFPGSYSYMMSPCNTIQCGNEIYSHRSAADGKNEEISFIGQGFSGSDFETLNCFVDMGTGSKDFPACGPCSMGNLAPTTNSSGGSRRKGANGDETTG